MGEVLEHKKSSNTIESNFAQMKLGTLEEQVWCYTKSEGNSWANMYFKTKKKRKELVYTIQRSSL